MTKEEAVIYCRNWVDKAKLFYKLEDRLFEYEIKRASTFYEAQVKNGKIILEKYEFSK